MSERAGEDEEGAFRPSSSSLLVCCLMASLGDKCASNLLCLSARPGRVATALEVETVGFSAVLPCRVFMPRAVARLLAIEEAESRGGLRRLVSVLVAGDCDTRVGEVRRAGCALAGRSETESVVSLSALGTSCNLSAVFVRLVGDLMSSERWWW